MADHDGHGVLGMLFKHAAVMTVAMAIPGVGQAAALGLDPTLWNGLAIGFNGTVDMMVVDPITELGPFFKEVTLDGGLDYVWGTAGHHGGHVMQDVASSGALEHAGHGIAHNVAEHAATSTHTASHATSHAGAHSSIMNGWHEAAAHTSHAATGFGHEAHVALQDQIDQFNEWTMSMPPEEFAKIKEEANLDYGKGIFPYFQENFLSHE